MGGIYFATYFCYLEVDNTCTKFGIYLQLLLESSVFRNVCSMKNLIICVNEKWFKKINISPNYVQSHCVNFKARFLFSVKQITIL